MLERLQQNHLKINLEKCIFGNKDVSYLGFTLTPEGIKPGKNKLKAIQTAKAPADVKTIRSFIGLCNFFRTHIKDFAVIASPLFRLTQKDSGYKGGPLPETAMDVFINLRKQLISEPVMSFFRIDCQYALITDAATGTADMPGGLGAILTQVDKDGKFYAISFASRQLKDHEKNYSPFLLEAAAAVWGMDHFNEYLKGKNFILYMDHKPLDKLGHLHNKRMNRFQMALLEHDFIIQYKKGSDMPPDTCPDFRPPPMNLTLQLSTLSKQIWHSCKEKNHLPRICFTLASTTGGQIIFPSLKPIITPISSRECSMTRRESYGPD